MTDEAMPLGLYEALLTQSAGQRLANLNDLIAKTANVDPVDQPHVLARHVYELTRRALEDEPDHGARIDLVNALIGQLEREEEQVSAPARQLLRLSVPPGPGMNIYEDVRPATPLADAALLTNARGEPSLGAELRAEIDTSDEVDLLCAFVKWHGLRLLEPELLRLRQRGAPLRVITTTYMGATERAALDRLVRELGGDVNFQVRGGRTNPLREQRGRLANRQDALVTRILTTG